MHEQCEKSCNLCGRHLSQNASTASAALAPVEETEGKCGSLHGKCLHRKCCATPELTCYEKDEWHAQCLPTGDCKPGFRHEDPVETPWSCVVLSPPAPSPAPGPAPAPPPPVCADKDQHCAYWARAGECDKNAAHMHEQCAKSCNLCWPAPAPPPPVCADNGQHCAEWARAGECDTNAAYMHEHCAKSCNLCGHDFLGHATNSSLRGGR
ncbi:unnamed protein product [Polarella glacialis]|uniref:ShKT domain-containing protein n=1 Tax=Polarella glacialis TaxID=89957 RepID=A0A813HAE8_POLGL|nr:unnamed protein product [Polarella glacialis]